MPRTCLLLLLAFHFVSSAAAQMKPGDHKVKFTSSCDGTTQPYRLFVPSAADRGESLPLLIVLHGKSVDQNAWFDLTPVKVAAEKEGFVVAAPHGRGNVFYRAAGEQDVLDIIADVRRLCDVDPDRIYLMGHSMGGWGTWWIGLRHPDLFAAICPMSGMAPVELMPAAQHLAPFIIHDRDDAIVRVEESRVAAEELARLGISFQFREEHGYGHSSKLIGDNFARTFAWMKEHRRMVTPSRVRLAARTPAGASAWWLRILETTRVPRLATADAELRTSTSLTIQCENVAAMAINLNDLPSSSSRAKLRVAVNDALVTTIETRHGWLVLRTNSTRRSGWSAQLFGDSEPPRYHSPVIGEASSDLITTTTGSRTLTDRIAKWLCKKLGADTCLFRDDMFSVPSAQLTLDSVLDLYVYAQPRLAIVQMDRNELAARLRVLARESPLLNVRLSPADASRRKGHLRIIAPLNIARRLGPPIHILPRTIAEYLVGEIQRTHRLP